MTIIKQNRNMLNAELNDHLLLFNILLAIYNVDDDVCFHFTIHYHEVLHVGTIKQYPLGSCIKDVRVNCQSLGCTSQWACVMHPELSPPCIYTTFITILPKLKTGRNSNDVELLLIKNIAVSVDRTRNIQIFSLTLSQLTYPRNLLLV